MLHSWDNGIVRPDSGESYDASFYYNYFTAYSYSEDQFKDMKEWCRTHKCRYRRINDRACITIRDNKLATLFKLTYG